MTEKQIQLGTALLTASQLAMRLGYRGKDGSRRVIALARAGIIPCWMPNKRTRRFSWPKVEQATMGKEME